MATEYANSGEYIKHHLTNLTFGQKADGSWGIAHGADEIKEMGFWSINVDTYSQASSLRPADSNRLAMRRIMSGFW